MQVMENFDSKLRLILLHLLEVLILDFFLNSTQGVAPGLKVGSLSLHLDSRQGVAPGLKVGSLSLHLDYIPV